MSANEQVSQTLNKLVGLTMWEFGESANLTWFQFGSRRLVTDRRGDSKEVGDYTLHIQCPWRISRGSEILHGSGDDQPQNTHTSLLVQAIESDELGGFAIRFEENTVFTVFPDFHEEGEYWRFFQPYTQHEHFVVTSEGILVE